MNELTHFWIRLHACAALAMIATAIPQARGQSDLTEDGAVARGRADAVVFDTRSVQPQVQVAGPWPGPVGIVGDHLPPHGPGIPLVVDEPNALRAGGMLREPRAEPGPLFPGMGQTPWIPPDPSIAVGQNHVVQTVNQEVAFFDRQGALQFQVRLGSSGNPGFFEELGAGDFTFDPKCLFDAGANRFVVLALEVYQPNQAWITFAVSDDADPHGVWYKYRTPAVVRVGDTTYWVDYPGLGYDHRGLYVTGNLFKLEGPGGGFGGVLYRCFDKAPLLVGEPARYNDLRDGTGGSVQVAHMLGTPDTPYFVQVAGTASLRLVAIRDPLGTPSLTFTTRSVPRFGSPGRNSVPNKDGTGIDAIDARIINVSYRNDRLLAGHTVALEGKNQARWYEFIMHEWPDGGTPELLQSGNIDAGPGVHTFFPALFHNKCEGVGMVVARSSADTYAGVYVTGRKNSDPLGHMGTLTEAAPGRSGYLSGRWGDYFDITLDPTDDETFWIVGEHAVAPRTWATWISSFNVCDDPQSICGDVKRFKARCSRKGKVRGTLRFREANHHGSTVTFLLDGEPIDVQVTDRKAKLSRCCDRDQHIVAVQTPPDCVEPQAVDCG